MVRKLTGFILVLIFLVIASNCARNQTSVPFTATSKASPTSTDVSFSTQTPIITSTASAENARERLRYFLQTNGDCTFPCFWGIRPDDTDYDELYDFIKQLGENGSETRQDNHLYVSSVFRFEERGGLYVDFQVDVQEEVVRNIVTTIDGLWRDDVFPRDWSAYTINEILGTYGSPDSIEIFLDIPNNTLAFGIRLRYEDLDTSILYSGRSSIDANNLDVSNALICPVENISNIKLHIGKQPFNYETNGVGLSDATTLDTQAFYELFTENPSACLTVNLVAMGLK